MRYSTLAREGLSMSLDSVAPFTYEAAPSRVVFGLGRLEKAPEEIDRLGAKRVLILTTPGRKKLGEELATRLGAKAAGVFSHAVMHVPAETAQAGRAEAARHLAHVLRLARRFWPEPVVDVSGDAPDTYPDSRGQ